MTNFVRPDKQVLVRQDAEMDICSSRMLGMKVEWWGWGVAQGGSRNALRLWGLWDLPKETQANFR